MELFGIITLVILGIMCVVVELFLMFGSIKVGAIGLAFLSAAIYMIYGSFGSYYGNIALVTVVLGTAILLTIALRFMSKREVGLQETLDESRVNVIDTNALKVGDVGIAQGDLKLGGRVRINGETFDAESIGSFIDEGTKIMVTKVNSHQIFVKPIEDQKYMGINSENG